MKTKLTICVAVLTGGMFGMGCASTEPAFVSEGLVAYYPFNGNANDESGNGHDGEVKGAVLGEDWHGKPESAYSYSKLAPIVVIKDNASLRSGFISLSAWVKPPSTSKYVSIIFKQMPNNLNEQYHLGLFLPVPNSSGGPPSTIDFAIKRNSKGYPGRGWWRPITNAKVPINEWSHIVGTWDGSKQKIFLNGALVGTKTNTPSGKIDNLEGGDISISALPNTDDVRIYNRALSAEEVKALYDLEKPKTK